jgi:Mg2+-importing ATPase
MSRITDNSGSPATKVTSAATNAWWAGSRDALVKRLNSGVDGLGAKEAARRLREVGPNRLEQESRRAVVLEFLSRFRNPLVLILLVASGLSALLGDVTSFVIILVVVSLSVTIDFVQEHRAGEAATKLRKSVAVRATALRGNAREDVPVDDLVPGDVVLLAAGDLVPADGRVLDAKDFFVNQAMLTGESFPVEKHVSDAGGEIGDSRTARDAVFMGTAVISGTARMLVCATGRNTALGAIAGALATMPLPTAFEAGTRRFGMLIMRVTVLLVLFVLAVNAWQARPLFESFLFAVALAVGLTPELLPMIVTVTLSRGALRMASRKVIVKRLSAVQDLGSMDVLCTDKTGTLTEAKIRLERHEDAYANESERVLQYAYLNSHFETGLRSPLDDAILAHRNIDVSAWTKIDEAPFDFERRRVSVLVDDGARRMLVVKGAPEDILALSTRYQTGGHGTTAEIDREMRNRLVARFEQLGEQGFRVLAVAWRQTDPGHPHAVLSDETELVFAGFAAFLDPPKASASAALQALRDSGVEIKVVTGDNERVTQHICREVGITVSGVLTGAEMAGLDDAALAARIEGVNLFCRVNPAQKERIILALKRRGRVVGYLGDGINDAPSLHAADVGISVDGAVDVAKEAADLLLLKGDLHVLHDGIVEGRRTFANIMKYIMMGTSSNFGNMFSMAGATLIVPFLPMRPVQILLNNMLYDLSEIAIPLDRVDKSDVARPQRWDMNFIRDFMLAIGLISSLFDFLTFFVLLQVLKADAPLFQTGWFIESLATQVLVIFVIRTRGSALASRPHPLLAATSISVVAIAMLLPFTPIGAYFGFVAPPIEFFLILVLLIVVYLALVETAKLRFFAGRAIPARPTSR